MCADDTDCIVDGNSQCDTINNKCECKTGFASTGTQCERKSNRDVFDRISFIKHWIRYRLSENKIRHFLVNLKGVKKVKVTRLMLNGFGTSAKSCKTNKVKQKSIYKNYIVFQRHIS